jgi:hypothetical protein
MMYTYVHLRAYTYTHHTRTHMQEARTARDKAKNALKKVEDKIAEIEDERATAKRSFAVVYDFLRGDVSTPCR